MEEFLRRALEGLWPDTSRIIGGDVINGRWTKEIGSAEEAYTRLAELGIRFRTVLFSALEASI